MRIQLKSPLHISVPELGKYIPNSRSSANSIYDKTNFHSILMMSEKVEGGYTEIDTYLEFEEFAKIINQIPLSLTKDLILALGKAGYELPKLYQVALEKNEVEIVERLLEKKADPNEKHNFHPTFFIDAIYRKREKLTLLLLKHKADIHQLTSSPYSLTPLMIAAWTDQPEIVRALLEEKSDPGLVGEKGHTALYMAVQSRSLDLVKTILGKKIDSNQPVGDESPLCLAVRNNDIEIVKTLVSHQADIELASGKYTPLILALLHENPKIAEYLIEKKANCTDPKVIIYASDNANADLIEKILAEKADINARSQDEAGMTALMYAASKGGVNIVKKLLEKNANLLAETKLEKKTALHFAVEEGYSQVVAELIEKKSNINAECKVGRALQLAMQKNQPAIVEMLLKAGADTNIKILGGDGIGSPFSCRRESIKNGSPPAWEWAAGKNDGEDLLTYAVHHDMSECVDILMKHGCQPPAIDPYRLIDYAYQEGYKKTFEILMQHDKQKINQYIEIRKNNKLKKISVTEIPKNSSYANVLDHMNKETAARVFQHAWRKKHPSRYKIKYHETLQHPLSMRFIQEPAGFKAAELAEKIKANDWLALDFDDSEFERNLYKALRQKKITVNEMATAYFLYQARDMCQDEKRSVKIRQHAFDDKGPYSPESISYAETHQLHHFKDVLSKLPENEQSYFSVDFSRKAELVFICDGIENQTYLGIAQFQDFVEKFIKKMRLSEKEKNNLIQDFRSLTTSDNSHKKEKLIASLVECYPDLKEFYSQEFGTDPERDTPILFVATFGVNDENPCVAISPDYDENNSESPLLCHIIPTVTAFNTLQESVHSNDATYPFFTAGQVSTRLIRKLDETPRMVGMSDQARPVELKHPDLVLTPNPHEVKNVHPYQVSAHDMFHCWRNGAITIKPLIRYLRTLHESVKGYDMSKYIWRLTDMDTSAGQSARRAKKNNYKWDKSNWINKLIGDLSELYRCNSDNLFITLIDMLKNEQRWKTFLGTSLEKHFEFESRVLIFMDNIKKIIEKYPNQSILFYLLAYRLQVQFREVTVVPLGQRPFIIKEDVLIVESDGKNLTTHWSNNQGIQSKKVPIDAFKSFKYLPKPNESKTLSFLIDDIVTKFECIPFQYSDMDKILQKISQNPSELENMFCWDRNHGVRFKPGIVPAKEKNDLESMRTKNIVQYCEQYLAKLNDKKRKGIVEVNPNPHFPKRRGFI